VLADPAWLTATEAMGWPVHPVDTENFPQEEAVLSDFWDGHGNVVSGVRRTLSTDLRRISWNLYARSGERRYLRPMLRLNRFLGDWSLANENTGNKLKGRWSRRFSARMIVGIDHCIGERRSTIFPFPGDTGMIFITGLLEHYLTGDEQLV
jgi:hypothetical protein